MMTDDYGRSRNPHRLFRNKQRGVIAGVCAGLADYFGADVVLVRLITILLLIFLTPTTLVAYIVAAIVMPVRERGARAPLTPEEDRFWRDVEREPNIAFSDVRHRFRTLDERLRDIERVVTSEEWKLRRQFREIE